MGKGENEERMRRVSTKRGPHYVILKVEQKCRLIDITLIDIFAPRDMCRKFDGKCSSTSKASV